MNDHIRSILAALVADRPLEQRVPCDIDSVRWVHCDPSRALFLLGNGRSESMRVKKTESAEDIATRPIIDKMKEWNERMAQGAGAPSNLQGAKLPPRSTEAIFAHIGIDKSSLHDDTRQRLVNEAARRMAFEMDRKAKAWLQEQGWATPERARALSEAAVTLQREVERLRLALAEEIAGRVDRALSPNNAAGPGVYVGRVITAEELSERVMAAANRKVGFGPWAEDKL